MPQVNGGPVWLLWAWADEWLRSFELKAMDRLGSARLLFLFGKKLNIVLLGVVVCYGRSVGVAVATLPQRLNLFQKCFHLVSAA